MTAAAPPLPPPTSPYLQALRGAALKQQQRSSYPTGYNGSRDVEEDSDVCWVCGNTTASTQAYCSNTCRDADKRVSNFDGNDGNMLEELYISEPSPLLSPALTAVPALVPSRRSSNHHTTTGGTISSSRYSPAVTAAASKKATTSGSITPRRSDTGGRATTKTTATASTAGVNGYNHHNNGTSREAHRSSAGEGGGACSSSPPSSSATSSPAKTADYEDQVNTEDDIENLALPPAVHGSYKKAQAFDYVYPYGKRGQSTLVIPKSPPQARQHAKVPPSPATAASAMSSATAMRKSVSQQQQQSRQSQQQQQHLSTSNLTSPAFGPKSLGAPTSLANAAANTTPPLNPSEIITFRRRHYAADSINGHQKSSHTSAANSSTAASTVINPTSPALLPTSSGTGSRAVLSTRRHSSHGSHQSSSPALPAFSPLIKSQTSTSRKSPSSTDHTAASSTGTSANHSPRVRPVDASPSLAASSLSNLLRSTSGEYPAGISSNKQASKSDSLLVTLSGSKRGPASSSAANTGTIVAQLPSESAAKQSWLQRNKYTRNLFAFSAAAAGPSITPSNPSHPNAATSQETAHTHPNCTGKKCTSSFHQRSQLAATHHPLATYLTPLARRVSEPGSPFDSPAIYYTDVQRDLFDDSFSRTAEVRAVTATDPSNDGSINGGRLRRPSLGTSNTAPPGVISPSSGSGVKPQDYSGFAGFLFALHNQRKASAGGAASARLSALGNVNGQGTASDASPVTVVSDLYSTPESSESGYDAQDEEQGNARGRARVTRRLVTTTSNASIGAAATAKDTENVATKASTAKPELLKEKLDHVVKASNDRSATVTPGLNGANTSTEASPARSRPTRFLFGRGNAFKSSQSTSPADLPQDVSTPSVAKAQPEKHLLNAEARQKESTTSREGSQYIVNFANAAENKAEDELSSDTEDSLGEEHLTREKPATCEGTGDSTADNGLVRGRPTARRRSSSSAHGRKLVVSPFTTLEGATQEQTSPYDERTLPSDDGGRGRSRQRGSAALHRSVSPARSGSRARGRDSPRLKMR